MRIIHVSSYKAEFFNGIKSVLVELVPAQRALGNEVWVLNHEQNTQPVIEGERYVTSIRDFASIVDCIKPDFVLFHSLYGLKDVLFSYYLRFKNITYIVEPHGGTSKENAKKNALKKKIANFIYAKNFIRHAAGLVYLNEKEKSECVFTNIRCNAAVIPNGTHLHHSVGKIKSADAVRFIFLARIDIIQKGLDLLFPAIEKLNNMVAKDKVEFHFYGKARNPQWGRMFDEFIASSDSNVFFHGAAIGCDKEKAFEKSDIFILTSRYEGMPMAVLEALSFGLPCIVTPQTNMSELITENNAGWVTTTDIQCIADTLFKAYNEYVTNRDSYIQNALNAVLPYDWNKIAQMSVVEYSRLISRQ